MKRYDDFFEHDYKKLKTKKFKTEQIAGGFRCSHCRSFVVINELMGTANRNHCNICLWSKHVDINKGDRRSDCQAGMEPIGLTLKHEGLSKTGEIMLVHRCLGCPKISINRIARDDPEFGVLNVFDESLGISHEQINELYRGGIDILTAVDSTLVNEQLFGRI